MYFISLIFSAHFTCTTNNDTPKRTWPSCDSGRLSEPGAQEHVRHAIGPALYGLDQFQVDQPLQRFLQSGRIAQLKTLADFGGIQAGAVVRGGGQGAALEWRQVVPDDDEPSA